MGESSHGTAVERPNIVLIMSDQQRFDSLGCYAASWVRTPHLDRMAAEGVAFDNCYVNNTICTPSRASLWTGKHLPGHGVYKLYDTLPEDEIHFSEELQKAGYRTGLFGKLHTSGRMYEANTRHPHDGFDEYEWALEASIHLDSPYNGYSSWLRAHHPDFLEQLKSKGREVLHHPKEVHFTHWAAERSVDFIRRHAGKRPFFCCMSLFDPHNPYEDYPEEMNTRVDEETIPEPLSDERKRVPDGVAREREHSYLGSYKDFSAEEVGRMRFGYYASIAFIDQEVGRVLAALEEEGVSRDTLVIFSSDHGDMLGDHGLLVKGAFFYDPAVKVPLIIRWPSSVEAGMRVKELVQPNDIAATILEAAGVIEPTENDSVQYHDAVSLLPLMRGRLDRIHDHVVCAYRNSGISNTKRAWEPPIHSTMIRDSRYKLSVYHSDIERKCELFDMYEDPEELHDLYEESGYEAIGHGLMKKLVTWMFENELRYLGSRGSEMLPDRKDELDNMMRLRGADDEKGE